MLCIIILWHLKEAIQLGVIHGPLSGNARDRHLSCLNMDLHLAKPCSVCASRKFKALLKKILTKILIRSWSMSFERCIPHSECPEKLFQNWQNADFLRKSVEFQWKPKQIWLSRRGHSWITFKCINISFGHASYFYASDTVLETLWQRFRHTFLCILLTKYSNFEAWVQNLTKMGNPKLDGLL